MSIRAPSTKRPPHNARRRKQFALRVPQHADVAECWNGDVCLELVQTQRESLTVSAAPPSHRCA